MKRDIRKAVEEIKSAGMEEFLHQDPSTFDCDDDCFSKKECSTDCRCPRTKCTRVKHCTFVSKCTRVKKCTFVTKCTRVRVQKWTFVTKVTRVKKCTFVTKRTRVKKCTFVTKCVRFEKKFFWTKRCFCKKCVFIRDHDKKPCHHSDCHDGKDHHSDCHDWKGHKHSFCKNKKFDHFWYKKRNC
ncbi:exosporium protein ExsB [Bacillus gaemokensis]|uniref:Spore coat protein G n=1 Tax=Bacillus gaemokensis TaxID=574375 RepID=A0A073KER0_9BACI|nr:exosporium protein ExsB [Bacillus gaemokensis]KEK24966.1 Spore coat protein G [Bacillus gaemokensis]KYG32643.1 spore coat protein G [Bacillus gaemokensis]